MIRSFAILAFGLLSLAAAATGRAEPPAPRIIAVFGDSQAQGVAGALQRMALHDRGIHVVDKSVPGTSISQKQQLDWAATIEQFLATEHPDVAVMMIGGNDRLAMRTEAGGHPIAFKTDAWKAIFAERLTHILKSFADAHVPVVWLGEPIAREPTYSGDMAYLNGIYAETVTGPGTTWMPLWDIVTDETGAYAAYGKGLDGETKRLRLDDGVHFTPAGYDIVAQKLRTQIDGILSAAAPAAVAAHS
ncbi:MAG TPA: DUF459 domain-containing protein [Aliidongia sp.]|nr:DUF459 domain-containing protein [Aliidongia sp.]